MQSNYETAGLHNHHQQQFMDTDCCPSAFPISNSPKLHYHQNNPLHQHHRPPLLQHSQEEKQQQQQEQEQKQQQRSMYFQVHPIPTTYRLFQQQHQFQEEERRLHQQLWLEQQLGQSPHTNLLSVNFKLGLNENSGKGEGDSNGKGGDFLGGNEPHVPDTRPHSVVMPNYWQPPEDSTIKEPFWKPLNADQSGSNKMHKQVDENERCKDLGNKYRLFCELEAVCSLAKLGETNQTGSGSALTCETSPTNAGLPPMPYTNVGVTNAIGVDHDSEASIGEEASLRKNHKRKRKMKEQMSSMIGFFENLVKQVMNHQEGLHKRFLEVIGRMDSERTEREEAWRRQETAKSNREAIARAHEQALASSREALIVAYIEKITGRKINLPSRETSYTLQSDVSKEPMTELTPKNIDTNSRWPQAEVEALIQARSSLEPRFQEPGLKGPLWEEVSSLMASMGYQRSAKRCKEKWENINKYFRKTKESGKKRSQQSKTCSYFGQLDQLYSRSGTNVPISSFSKPSTARDIVGVHGQSYTDLLEAFAAVGDLGFAQNLPSENFKVSELGSNKLDFDGIYDNDVELEQGSHGEEDNREDEVNFEN